MEPSKEDKIDAYLRGELNEADKQQFEETAEQDEELARELAFRKLTLEHLELLEDRKIADQVQAVHQAEIKQRQGRAKVKRLRFLAMAAAILLLLSFAWWLWPSAVAPDALYAEYYAPYELPFGNRNEMDALTEAGVYYQSGDYEQAVPAFRELLAQDPSRSKVTFALGISQMELQQWPEASAHFQQLIEQDDPLYAGLARWYLSLCYLKMDNTASAVTQLETLADDTGAVFQEEASQLLKAIK